MNTICVLTALLYVGLWKAIWFSEPRKTVLFHPGEVKNGDYNSDIGMGKCLC